MSDLKPCPFCGSDNIDMSTMDDDPCVGGYDKVECRECGVEAYGFQEEDWNTRADSWISVDERLPNPDFDWVLVYSDSAMATMMYTKNNGFHGYTPNHIAVSMITHWKPLPPAPTK